MCGCCNYATISLYVCFNEKGAKKEEEHPWFREGIKTKLSSSPYSARWISDTEIGIRPFPFKAPFQVTIKTKQVSKRTRSRIGIELAYQETDYTEHSIIFSDLA
ncbi:DUF3891 family protein [Cohnella terricola]|uniref:DUF3891 family protein n=1 Tax=Cohnella terricola TaxID=1289167 RepID=A0A559J8W9_9BACL|nr:DUF3891 family protein [Cohnella terricola]